jgi:GWxTD domain-containing protein
MLRHYIILGWLAIIYTSCVTTQHSTPNYATLYQNSGANTLNPSYIVYHKNDNETQLHFKFETDKILYARKDKTQPFQSKVAIHYRVFSEGSTHFKNLIDSATHYVEDITPIRTKKSILGTIKLKMELGKNYRLYVRFTDLNKNVTHERLFTINKSDVCHAQFFMLMNPTTGQPHFESFYNKDARLQLFSEMNSHKTLYAHYYQREFPIAPPPFGLTSTTPFQYKPDVPLQYSLDAQGKYEFDMFNRGFVHFLVDTTKREGFTLYRFDNNYPEIKNAYGMIDPLKFICTKNEYETLTTAENPKIALDNFWLGRTGSKERAREIIKKFYNRVHDANYLFTSYVEGWKTDRGMISIIFGLPKTVRRDNQQEVWIYGEESNIMSLQFVFSKVTNPFSAEDFRLQRSPNYKTNWYRAVDAWRSGRVYWAQ